ncbi:MAG: REP-associated tyrosine transposase [Anaerolineae bacterium]
MGDHHPPHIFLDDAWYFISVSTLDHARFLASGRAKALVRDQLKELITEFGVILRAWVILDDHYHLLLKTNIGKDLSRLLGRLHGATARRLNLWDDTVGRQVWHNYWDTCIRSEASLWRHFNYIHNNPVKHGYVAHPGDWEFSSYRYYLRKNGEQWLADCWERYPVIDYTKEDNLSRPKQLEDPT